MAPPEKGNGSQRCEPLSLAADARGGAEKRLRNDWTASLSGASGWIGRGYAAQSAMPWTTESTKCSADRQKCVFVSNRSVTYANHSVSLPTCSIARPRGVAGRPRDRPYVLEFAVVHVEIDLAVTQVRRE